MARADPVREENLDARDGALLDAYPSEAGLRPWPSSLVRRELLGIHLPSQWPFRHRIQSGPPRLPRLLRAPAERSTSAQAKSNRQSRASLPPSSALAPTHPPPIDRVALLALGRPCCIGPHSTRPSATWHPRWQSRSQVPSLPFAPPSSTVRPERSDDPGKLEPPDPHIRDEQAPL